MLYMTRNAISSSPLTQKPVLMCAPASWMSVELSFFGGFENGIDIKVNKLVELDTDRFAQLGCV